MPAKKGRPPKYTEAEKLQHKIDLYFLACKVQQTGNTEQLEHLPQEDLKIIDNIDCVYPTVTGLALVLGMTRKGLIEYENKDDVELGNTIKKAKQKVEGFLEQRLYHNNAAGTIFNLKNNYKWVDATERKLSGGLDLILDEIDGDTAGLPEDQG